MNQIFSLALTGTLALGTAAAQAQQRPASEAATAGVRLAEDIGLERLPGDGAPLGGAQNAATLLQNGTGNAARIDQQSLSTLSNQAYVVQVGAANVVGLAQAGANSAYVSQNGTGNTTSFTQDGQGNTSAIMQKGTANKLTGLVKGDNNTVNVTQDGQGNTVESKIQESNRAYEIKQYGTNNTLKQLESTTQAKGYGVEMRGNGINLTIEQGKIAH
ncbi:hypothetical protein [Hymenobacter sp. PAMC 26628]|uniref:hypothetical protein n=1 Tax=Hymenobacter sp. PAMC 26628 TaxID=1484118 RepID=UPI00076FFFCE|nr:hypothetical protein [Hymenobacter sp. PAMC 26628]AMJ67445.1 hypothetical protein AXW84_19965 [Hymenobacter sp. PAMC 26628]